MRSDTEASANVPVTLVVNPNERSCDGLAQASKVNGNSDVDVDNSSGGLDLATPS
jgi:hypothetical protein